MELFKIAANAAVGLWIGKRESTYTGMPENWSEQSEIERILDYGFDFQQSNGTLYDKKINIIQNYAIQEFAAKSLKAEKSSLDSNDDFVIVEKPVV